MANNISPAKYAELSEDEQYFYDPDYRKYKVTKVRSYEDCDLGHTHFMGWVEERAPLGEPYRYIRDNSLTRQTMKLMKPVIIDSLNGSSMIANRILNSKKWDSK